MQFKVPAKLSWRIAKPWILIVLALYPAMTYINTPDAFFSEASSFAGFIPLLFSFFFGVIACVSVFLADLSAGLRLFLAAILLVISLPFLFAGAYFAFDYLDDECVVGASSLFDTLYFSYVAFTTLGFGDLQPNGHCRAIAAVQAVLGYLSLGLLVGVTNNFFQTRHREG